MIIACVNYVLTSVVMPYPQVLEVAQGPPGGHDEGVDAAPVEGHPGQAPDVALLRVPGHDELDLGLAGRLALGPRQHWHSGSHIMCTIHITAANQPLAKSQLWRRPLLLVESAY